MSMLTHAICRPLESLAVIVPTYVPCGVKIIVNIITLFMVMITRSSYAGNKIKVAEFNALKLSAPKVNGDQGPACMYADPKAYY